MNKMIDLFKNVFWYIIEGACTVLLHMLKYVPGAQKACEEEVTCQYRPLLEIYLLPISGLFFIPDHFKIQEMCNKEVDIRPHFLVLVPDHLNTEEMCNKAVCKHPWLLKYVLDWFVAEQQLKTWQDDDYYCNNDKIIKCQDSYKKRKSQKAKIKEEVMPIAWHPSR